MQSVDFASAFWRRTRVYIDSNFLVLRAIIYYSVSFWTGCFGRLLDFGKSTQVAQKPNMTKRGIYITKMPLWTNSIIRNNPSGIIEHHKKSRTNLPSLVVFLPIVLVTENIRRLRIPTNMHRVMIRILCIEVKSLKKSADSG